MAVVDRPFLDTSVLLGGLIQFGEISQGPMALMDTLSKTSVHPLLTAWHCCLEFYSVATRLPEEYRLTPRDAHTLLKEEVFSRFEVGGLTAADRLSFLETAMLSDTTGGRVYDHHIFAVASHLAATVVVTENTKHFTPLASPDLPVLSSAEFLSYML